MLCQRCLTDKPETEFHAHKAYARGRSSWCRACHRAANREWYAKNKARQNAKSVEWRKRNPDAGGLADRRYKQKNADKLAKQYADWRSRNLDKVRRNTAKRKAAKLRATPAWASKAEIDRVYRLARELQDVTGVPMHVDHIVPLQHPMVCGLHCEKNLQIIPARFNEGKKNYWWPHMFEETRKAYAQPDMFVEASKAEQPKQESLFGGGEAA